jgi:lipoprotein NlpD
LRIAKAQSQRSADLIAWNRLPADGKVQAGQLLRVAPPVAAAPAPATAVSNTGTNTNEPAETAAAKTPAPKPAAPASNNRFIWPIEGHVAESFNVKKSTGVVIAGPPQQQVKAASSGRVVYAGSGIKAYGNLVIVKHDTHLITAYGRNARLLVKEGDAVKQGQAIAVSGPEGAATTSLVFEVRNDGTPVDPLAWLPKAQP